MVSSYQEWAARSEKHVEALNELTRQIEDLSSLGKGVADQLLPPRQMASPFAHEQKPGKE